MPTSVGSPDLKIGIMEAVLSYLGKIPWVRERLTMWTRRGVKVDLLDLSREAGSWSKPVAQFLRLSTVLLSSS